MPEAIVLKTREHQRLVRLAQDAECTVDEIFRDVLRDGLDYTEYKVKAVNESLADLSAGRMISIDELKARLARRRAGRGQARSKVA